MNRQAKHFYEFGPFRLDAADRLLLRDGERVPLPPKVFDTLLIFVENSGHTLDKDELMKMIWPDTFVEENNLNQHVSALRKVLGDTSNGTKYIETIPKRGYRFVAEVGEVWEEDADLVVTTHARSRVLIEEETEETREADSAPPTAAGQAPVSTASPRVLKRIILAGTISVLVISLYFIWPPGVMRRKPLRGLAPRYKQLSFTGDASFPAISRDGKFIAYVTGQAGSGRKVMVQEVAGGQPLEVFQTRDCQDLRWSPDGSELIVSAGSETFLVPRLGGSPRRFPGGGHAGWSADGSEIAVGFMMMKKVFFFNKLTGERTSINLAGTFQWVTELDWSPTGDWLLFATSEKGTQKTLWTIKRDGTGQQKILEHTDDISSPRWSRGGDVIYFLRGKDQTKDLWKIPIIPATGGPKAPASVVLTGLQAGRRFTVSTDGKRLLYGRGLGYSNLWLGTPEGPGENQRIKTAQLTTGTSSIHSPNISPDGKWIAFVIAGGSTSNIYKMPIEGGTPQQLTFWDSYNDPPAWSPDGTKIAFGSNQGGAGRVWVVSAEGGPPRQLAKSELDGHCEISWAPGANILYQQSGHRNFLILNLDTEEERPLVRVDSVGWMSYARYSPDGNRVAVWWNRRPRGIWVISLDGSSEFLVHEVARGGSYWPLGWSPDGNWIYISKLGDEGRILKLPVTGGEPSMVANLPYDNIWYLSMAPDGKKFVFTVHEEKRDVWLVEDFDGEMP
jgi:Tol biopolymer transport system component/DNA-binding winged helix-turn-helix (wHTH) protein